MTWPRRESAAAVVCCSCVATTTTAGAAATGAATTTGGAAMGAAAGLAAAGAAAGAADGSERRMASSIASLTSVNAAFESGVVPAMMVPRTRAARATKGCARSGTRFSNARSVSASRSLVRSAVSEASSCRSSVAASSSVSCCTGVRSRYGECPELTRRRVPRVTEYRPHMSHCLLCICDAMCNGPSRCHDTGIGATQTARV